MECLLKKKFAEMVDMVELSPTTTINIVEDLIHDGVDNHFHSIGCPYCFHPFVFQRLKEMNKHQDIVVLGGAGFADGNWPTEVKLASVKRCLTLGCREIDLTSNLSWIKSGMYDDFKEEVNKVRAIVKDLPMKLIIHSPQLTENELEKVCKIAMESGVDYIKTDTGRSPSPTDMRQIRLIQQFTEGKMKIKASGGIRDLTFVEELVDSGVERLGMSRLAAMKIFNQLEC